MRLDAVIAPQRGHLFPWVPVFLAIGIGGFFALPIEFGPVVLGFIALAGLMAGLASYRVPESWAPLVFALALIAVGLSLAGWRTERVAEPVLGFRYYGPIEGRIIEIDRSQSDKVRLTFDQVTLSNTHPDRIPAKVRVSLHGQQGFTPLTPGARVMLTGTLSPPMGPAEPGGFDFRRMAWFEQLGAVGCTRNPVVGLEPARLETLGLKITAVRMALSQSVQAQLPGQPGAFAAAVVTGDRSGLSRETLDAMRGSNLAHLLAISGLHMGLLTGFVFLVLRYGIAMVPYVALRWDGRKIAAVVALVVAVGYLALSGGSVATQRAFVMAAVMLGAVMLDRRMLTLRAVALAAVLILIWRPESLTQVGFQMSFAATTALVWVFSQIRDMVFWQKCGRLRPVIALVISSGVAGLATAPIGAANFNQVAQFGLIANLLAVPMMGLVVMPAAVLAACLAPLGLASVGLWVMGLGCRWILWVAGWITSFEASVVKVVAPMSVVIPMLVLGCLFVILWQGRARWGGLVPVCVAMIIWSHATRPPVLIADSGALVGVMRDGARVLNKPKGDGFVASSWLENDGDGRDQAAAARPDKAGFTADLGWMRLRQLTKRQVKSIEDPCQGVEAVVLPDDMPVDCLAITAKSLRDTGAIAIWPGPDGPRIVTAADKAGARYWTDPTLRKPSQNLSDLFAKTIAGPRLLAWRGPSDQ